MAQKNSVPYPDYNNSLSESQPAKHFHLNANVTFFKKIIIAVVLVFNEKIK